MLAFFYLAKPLVRLVKFFTSLAPDLASGRWACRTEFPSHRHGWGEERRGRETPSGVRCSHLVKMLWNNATLNYHGIFGWVTFARTTFARTTLVQSGLERERREKWEEWRVKREEREREVRRVKREERERRERGGERKKYAQEKREERREKREERREKPCDSVIKLFIVAIYCYCAVITVVLLFYNTEVTAIPWNDNKLQ